MNEIKLKGESKDIIQDNVSKLREIFPEIVTEDKIDFDKLKLILGNNIDENPEKYNFTWPGKTQAIKESQKTSSGTLRPCKEESKNWDSTENLYIEGDNLEVLKLLQKSYYGKIKLIYIDPPYNTGKDFIYSDNYKDNLENYLKLTGQIVEEGERERESIGIKLSTNTEITGRYHSNWLNMMYPRLKLAKNLLSDDGIIFISIDDNEVDNLKKLCNEIFGEENFLSEIIVNGTPKNDPYIVSTAHEYCLVYTKNFNFAKEAGFGIKNPLYKKIEEIYHENENNLKNVEFQLKKFYKDNNLTKNNISNYKFADEQGVFRLGPIDDPQNSGPKDERINPKTNTTCIIPNRGWSCSKETWDKWIENGLIFFPENNEKIPSKKTYINKNRLDVMKAYFKMQTRKDTDALKRLFGTDMPLFSNPKPKELIKIFVENCNDSEMLVLDFFSGSGTTAEAVIDLNKEDGGNRKFILVQIPEEISVKTSQSNKLKKIAKTAIKFLKSIEKQLTLCEIGKERIRRAGDKILEESDNKDLDVGFKVFKLDSSNLEKWNPEYDNLEQTLLTNRENIKEDRTELDLIYEIMLKYGIDLTLPIKKSNNIYSIGYGALLICLDDNITKEIANEIIELKSENITRVVFKESGFKSDADKTNIKETLRINNIDEFITI